jgi:ABC-type nitrate/sulfonate/bicarbonate transport system ATPase subunit
VRAGLGAEAHARATQSPLLLLDEAASSLDEDTEMAMVTAIHEGTALGRGQARQTVLTIAHRLKSVVNSDKILVMAKGQSAPPLCPKTAPPLSLAPHQPPASSPPTRRCQAR